MFFHRLPQMYDSSDSSNAIDKNAVFSNLMMGGTDEWLERMLADPDIGTFDFFPMKKKKPPRDKSAKGSKKGGKKGGKKEKKIKLMPLPPGPAQPPVGMCTFGDEVRICVGTKLQQC